MEENRKSLPRATRELQQEYDEVIGFLNAHRWSENRPKEELDVIDAAAEKEFHLYNDYDWNSEFFEENGKPGLRNCFGEVEIPPIYDDIQSGFYRYQNRGGFAVVKKDGKYYKAKRDGKGTIIFTSEFTYLQHIPFSNYDIVRQDPEDKENFALALGNTMLTPQELTSFGREIIDGCIILYIGDKCGVYDIYNKLYIKPEYDDYNPQGTEEPFIFTKDGVQGYVTLKGRFVSLYDMEHDDVAHDDDFDEGLIGDLPVEVLLQR
jgi:hypothetical protein